MTTTTGNPGISTARTSVTPAAVTNAIMKTSEKLRLPTSPATQPAT